MHGDGKPPPPRKPLPYRLPRRPGDDGGVGETHRLFIVSNSQQGYPELCISKLGLTGCITGHLCFGDTGTSKGKTIRTLMEKYNITSCAYIGDTQGDYEATVEAGVPFLWASYGFGTPAGYAGKIDSFEELLKL